MAESTLRASSRTRKSTGSVVPPGGARKSWTIRFRAYGKRYTLAVGRPEDGWNRQKAEEELENVLADVRRGIWRPPTKVTPRPEIADVPDFQRFASDWLAGKATEVTDGTYADYLWALELHLLPFFADHRLDEITIEEVDRYKRQKASEGALSAATTNKTLTRLAQVLEDAVEYGHLNRNPARGRRRRLKADRPRAIYLDTVLHIETLLEAASAADGSKLARTSGRRAMVATFLFAGLRASEACELRWRDVDLGSGRITVRKSKTAAGVRQIDVLPVLRDELGAFKPTDADPLAPVFPTGRGGPRDKDNVARRVIKPVVEKADEILAARDKALLPEGITAHKLRHTFASLLAACGEDPSYVMAQIGHTDPKFTFRVYAHTMSRRDGERDRLKALVQGDAISVGSAAEALQGSERR